ncbi:MAG: FAD:protein FMN transferase [Candidatus Omnitrophica bacterium]|nr:FAD:protein FMN transferase [Candidatus Omnitrophota bacterium]
MKPQFLSKLLIIVFISLIFSGCSYRDSEEAFTLQRKFLMGTIVEVTSNSDQAAKIVFDTFKRLDEKLSHFKSSSPVAELNRDGIVSADKELLDLIVESLRISEESSGTFDITIGPLSDIWKKAIKGKELPPHKEIKKARELVDWKQVSVDRENGLIKFKKAGMKIDLGAIAKGFAVDIAVEKLKAAGISSALINAGGDIYCLGKKFNRPWKIAVRHPEKEGKFSQVFSLVDRAVATSGDYEQFFTLGGKRYSHIVDPRTGYPIDSRISSVTVVSDRAMTSDALATAIFILGEKKGLALADKFEGIEVKIISR